MQGELTDEALISFWRRREVLPDGRDPLESLLRRYQEKIARWTLHALGNREDAADCAQEALVRMSRGLERFRDESRFSTWAYVVTRKACATALARRQKTRDREMSTGDPEALEAASSEHHVPDDRMETNETRTKLRSILQRHISSQELDILLLHHVDGLSMKQITARLGLENASGARAFLASAKRKLRAHLRPGELEALGFPIPDGHEDPR